MNLTETEIEDPPGFIRQSPSGRSYKAMLSCMTPGLCSIPVASFGPTVCFDLEGCSYFQTTAD